MESNKFQTFGINQFQCKGQGNKTPYRCSGRGKWSHRVDEKTRRLNVFEGGVKPHSAQSPVLGRS